MNQLLSSIRTFAIEEDGAQVVEYALIIAVVSIALVLALQGLTTGGYFQSFIDRVAGCLQGDMGVCTGGAGGGGGGEGA